MRRIWRIGANKAQVGSAHRRSRALHSHAYTAAPVTAGSHICALQVVCDPVGEPDPVLIPTGGLLAGFQVYNNFKLICSRSGKNERL